MKRHLDKSGPVQQANIAFSFLMVSLTVLSFETGIDLNIMQERLFDGWFFAVWAGCALVAACLYAKATTGLFHVTKAILRRSARRVHVEAALGLQIIAVRLDRPVQGKWFARLELLFNVMLKSSMKYFAVPFATLGWVLLSNDMPLLGTIVLIHAMPAIAIATCHTILTLPDTLTHKLVLKGIRGTHRLLHIVGEQISSVMLVLLKV